MSDKEFPSCAYDVCAEFDCEETMALALIATRNDLERIRKALDKAKWWLKEIVESHRYTPISTAEMALKEITALEQKGK